MTDTNNAPDLVEAVARAIAKASGIEICSDALYRFSTFGPKAEAAIAAARPMIEQQERERCAKVADEVQQRYKLYWDDHHDDYDGGADVASGQIAEAIRALKPAGDGAND